MRHGIYARIKDEWLIKVKGSISPGDSVIVIKRDSTRNEEFVDQVVFTQQGYSFCSIARGITKQTFSQRQRFIEQETKKLLESRPIINTEAEYQQYKDQHPETDLPDFSEIPFDPPYIIRDR
jgi:hypothetical protein